MRGTSSLDYSSIGAHNSIVPIDDACSGYKSHPLSLRMLGVYIPGNNVETTCQCTWSPERHEASTSWFRFRTKDASYHMKTKVTCKQHVAKLKAEGWYWGDGSSLPAIIAGHDMWISRRGSEQQFYRLIHRRPSNSATAAGEGGSTKTELGFSMAGIQAFFISLFLTLAGIYWMWNHPDELKFHATLASHIPTQVRDCLIYLWYSPSCPATFRVHAPALLSLVQTKRLVCRK